MSEEITQRIARIIDPSAFRFYVFQRHLPGRARARKDAIEKAEVILREVAMSEEQVRELVRKRAARFAKRKGSTGFSAWCRHNGVAKSHASEFMRGIRGPTSDLLSALGLEYRIARKHARPNGSAKGGDT
jgi:hypothetical protein